MPDKTKATKWRFENCPFCNKQPVMKAFLGKENNWLGCVNEDCPVCPAALDYTDEESLVFAWNTRETSQQTTLEEQNVCGYDRLWLWFGLDRASFLTLPRVLMHGMPDEWQGKMASLLREYEDTFDTSELPNTTVRATRNGKLVGMPEFLLNYRRPDEERINICRTKR